jgi:hypothetical protein
LLVSCAHLQNLRGAFPDAQFTKIRAPTRLGMADGESTAQALAK